MKKKNVIGLTVIVALSTAAGFLWAKARDLNRSKPPKKAPQVPLNNPGEQSEFRSAASESELG